MKAVLKTRREPGIEVLDVPAPQISETDILVRVAAGSLCGSDVHIYEWTAGYDFIRPPLILGHEFSGEVVSVGPKVEGISTGDRVTAMPTMPCGRCSRCLVGRGDACSARLNAGMWSDGFFAEYGRLTAGASVFKLPESVSYDAASMLEPLSVALNGLDLSNFKVGNSVAVLGPGPIGLLLLLLVKAAGASLVVVAGTATDGKRLDLARRYGADVTIDVEREDAVAKVRELTRGRRSGGLDFVFEATGNPKSIPQALDMVRPGGKVLLVGIHSGPAQFDPTPMVRGRKALIGVYGYEPQTWQRGLALLASGRIDLEPMITHRLPLDRAEEGFELARTKEAVKVVFRP